MAIVVLGAGGRLGQLLRPVFPVEALWHSRKDVDIEDTDTHWHRPMPRSALPEPLLAVPERCS